VVALAAPPFGMKVCSIKRQLSYLPISPLKMWARPVSVSMMLSRWFFILRFYMSPYSSAYFIISKRDSRALVGRLLLGLTAYALEVLSDQRPLIASYGIISKRELLRFTRFSSKAHVLAQHTFY
jgi:hypothetical protein